MGTIPLPALSVKPIQQPDVLENIGRVLQIRSMLQDAQQRAAMAPYQQQLLEQQTQQGQMQNQTMQQDQQDNASFRAAMQDPSMRGRTIGQIADVLAQNGKISQKAWVGAKDADLKSQQTLGTMADNNLKTLDTAYKSTQPIYDIVQRMDDQTLAANWPTIAQRYDAIWQPVIAANPQLKANMPILNPNQPMTKAQIAQFGPMLSMGQAYTDAENERRKKAADTQKSEADAGIAQMNLERGGTTDLDKFMFDYLQSNGLPNTPQNRQKAFQEYTRQTKVVPAQVRVEGYGKTRFYNVLDTKNGNAPVMISAEELGDANQNEPGRYLSQAGGTKALNQTSLIEDIRGNIQNVRANLQNKQMPEFTADQRAQIAVALGNEHSQDALSAAFRGGVLGSLTPDQQDYLINMAQLKENAMAMRSVLGAGQGSEDLRSAILATLPGPRTPSKMYALNQLDKFEGTLNRLSRGVPNVPLRNMPQGSVGSQSNVRSFSVTAPNGKTYTFPDQASANAFKQRAGIQ